MAMTLAQKTDMYRFFAIAFNAAPGITYMDQLDTALAGGMTTKQVVNAFTTKAVFTAAYPNFLDNAAFATSLVNNVVGSSATADAKAQAVADIVGALNIAGTTRGDVIYTVFNNLANKAYTDATWGGTAQQLANQVAVAQYYTETLLGNATDSAPLKAVLAGVTNNTDVSTTAAIRAVLGAVGSQTFTLTTGVDNFTGTSASDIFNATLGTGATLTALDSLTGGGGNDTLNIVDISGGSALPGGLTISAVQTANVRAAGAATIDTSTGFTGLTTLNVTQSTGTDVVKVGKGTAVSVTDTLAGGLVTVTASDSAVTVNSAGAATVHGGGAANVTAAGTVTIDTASTTQTVTTAGGVLLSKATGAIVATDTAQAAVASTIDDGTSVTLTTTAKAAGSTSGTITIGGTTAPTGAITVTDNLSNAAAAAANGTGGAVKITGGTTVSVTQTAAQAVMATASTNSTLTEAAVTVTGKSTTTAVTVTQAPTVTAVDTVLAVAAVTETGSAVFPALTKGQTLITNGLTFTAGTAGTTAAQTAAAFANLTAGATQGNSLLGTYAGTLSGWTSGAVSTATVVFTSTAAGPVTDLAFTGNGTWPTITETQGVAVGKATGTGGITGGAVTVNDVNALSTTKAGTITSATLDGYGATSAVNSNSLATLTLANSTGQTVTVGNDKTSGLGATSLALTVNNLGAGSALNLDATTAAYKALAVTTATADSILNVTASAVTALTVAGTNAIDLTSSTLSKLATVTVSGSAGVTLASVASVTDINAAGTSGAMTVTNFDATAATYEGSSGVDKLTLSVANPSKAISLGAGNDTLTLASGTSAPTAVLDGGTGTDTLSMTAGDAATASGSAGFASKVIGFELLTLTGATNQTIDLAMLGNYNSVSTAGGNGLTLNNMSSGGTLTLTGAGTAYTIANAAFTASTSDVLNIAITSAGAMGTVTASKVETINISDSKVSSLTLVDTTATSIVVTGAGTLSLTSTGNTAVTSVDASGMTGGLTYTTAGTTAETVKGGAGVNLLTAAAGTVADTLIGGAGADTLTANSGLDVLTGGAGADTFVLAAAPATLNSYATITDASVGDTIKLNTAVAATFVQAKVVLGGTAVFQDYANAVVGTGGVAAAAGNIAWFQYGGDTYVVQNVNGAESQFNPGDYVVKLTGLVDLSHTSLNPAGATLLIG